MKTIIKIFLIPFLSLSLYGIVQAQYVTLQGKQFKDENGNNFFPIAMNYEAEIMHDNGSPTKTFKVMRSSAYGSMGWHLEGHYHWITGRTVETSLSDDFEKLKDIGFNTIRLILSPGKNSSTPISSSTSNPTGFMYKAHYFTDDDDGTVTDNDYIFEFLPADYDATDVQPFYEQLEALLDIAESSDIKVILLCSNGSGEGFYDRGSSYADALDYAKFLHVLASHLKDKPALMAYDIYNEPNWSYNRKLTERKEEVCNYVAMWYDSIKAADPNHLVTIGNTDMGDVMAWDGSVMKLDFISMHLYPRYNSFENYDKTKATTRMLDLIAWCNAMQRPWMIGETGFVTSPYNCVNNITEAVDGSYTDQYNFIAAVMPAVRDCGGSGFSWWNFQDTHSKCIPYGWYDPNDPTCTCNDWCTGTPSTPNDVHGNFFGMLAYGDPVNGVYDPDEVDKDGVDFTSTFDPYGSGTCAAPTAYYYNPHQYSGSNTITGTVLDNSPNHNPIKDAVIFANTTIFLSILPFVITKSRFEYTFTNSSGIYNLKFAPNVAAQTMIDDVTISAFGAERIKPPIFNSYYHLDKSIIEYDISVNSHSVTTGSAENFTGWNSITTSDLTIETGATSEIKARNEIHTEQEFRAYNGSEVHIFCEPTFSECTDYNGYSLQRQNNNFVNAETDNTETSDIEITFRKNHYGNSISIFPNPGNGIFNIILNSTDKNACMKSIIVYDLLNRKITTLKPESKTYVINLSNQPKGVYFLLVDDSKNLFNKKIIIN